MPTLSIDTSGIILTWSRDAEVLLGYTEAEALGRSIELIIPEHLRGRHHGGFARFVQTGVSTLPEVAHGPQKRRDQKAADLREGGP
jgi:PAS domain S-box-containing protein